MSDFSPDPDELASAYLDDDASVDERARVEADPALLARVEELRTVRDALRDPVTPPSTVERDAAIHAALAVSNVVHLDAARRQRRLRVASIAAAIVLVLGAAGVLIRSASNQNQDKFQAVAGSIGSSAGDAGAERVPQAASTAAGTTGLSTASRAALGSFADRASLTAAAQSQVHDPSFNQSKQAADSAAAGGGTGFAGASPPACLVPPPPDATNEAYAATAVLEGRSVQLDVFTSADGSLTLIVTDSTTCTQVFSQPV
ncbi:MAG: hypothetical protein QOI95_3379 [Acidimicrobiaceae bacterium]|jgi:hypothetical protein